MLADHSDVSAAIIMTPTTTRCDAPLPMMRFSVVDPKRRQNCSINKTSTTAARASGRSVGENIYAAADQGERGAR